MKEETKKKIKVVLDYLSNVVSWTAFTILIIVGLLLVYYYVSVRLYATRGEAYEPAFSVYTIVSESMEPTISKYDVIVNKKVDSIDEVEIDDVVTYISKWDVTYGLTITHRVVGFSTTDEGEKCLIVRGDNNTQNDGLCVMKKDLVGVAKAVVPGLGRIQFFLGSKLGWLLVIVVPALYIIVKDLLKVFRVFTDEEKIKIEEESEDDRKEDKE